MDSADVARHHTLLQDDVTASFCRRQQIALQSALAGATIESIDDLDRQGIELDLEVNVSRGVNARQEYGNTHHPVRAQKYSGQASAK